MKYPRRAWIATVLVVALGGVLFYVNARDFWGGRCWLPESLGYETVAIQFGDQARDVCFRLRGDHTVVNVMLGSNESIDAYATVSRGRVPGPVLYLLDYGIGVEWYVKDNGPGFMRRFYLADGRGIRLMSPDGSLAALTSKSTATESTDYEVVSTQTDTIVCRFRAAENWFDSGCESALQADGRVWNIRQAMDLEQCLINADLYVSDRHCVGFTDQTAIP